MPARSATLAVVVIAALVTLLDQATKLAVTGALAAGVSGHQLDLAKPWIVLEYTENQGAAFGLFASLGPLLAGTSAIIVAGLLYHFLRTERPPIWQLGGVALVVGGAIGNLIDRVRLGHVVDFISVGAWPNFNLADSAISVGVLLLASGWLQSGGGTDEARVR